MPAVLDRHPRRNPRPQEGEGRRPPRPLLPGGRDPGARRLRRRQPPPRPRRHEGDRLDHRLLRRPLHGRDGQDPQPRQAASCCPTCWPAARLADSAPADKLARYQEMLRINGRRFQTVTYINSTAAVKALSRLDRHLRQRRADHPPGARRSWKSSSSPTGTWGSTSQEVTGRKMILWDGACMVHEIFSVGDLLALKKKLPGAVTLAHPECPANIREHSDFVGGTEAMVKYVGTLRRADRFPGRHRGEHDVAAPERSTRSTATTRCRASPAPATSARTWPATRWKRSATACSTASRRSSGSRSFDRASEVLERSLLR